MALEAVGSSPIIHPIRSTEEISSVFLFVVKSRASCAAFLFYRKLRKSTSPFMMFGYEKTQIGEQFRVGVAHFFIYGFDR